jgi:6-phosphogluconolactonase (cycloisomerase 2 family)
LILATVAGFKAAVPSAPPGSTETSGLTNVQTAETPSRSGSKGEAGAANRPGLQARLPRFAYVVNFQKNNVSTFRVDAKTGVLTFGSTTATGTLPTALTLFPVMAAPRFAYVSHRANSEIRVYRVDTSNGDLTPVNELTVCADGSVLGPCKSFRPFVVITHPSGSFLYTLNRGTHNISAFTINPTNGGLTFVGLVCSGRQEPGGKCSASDPFSLTFDAAGKFAYVANTQDSTISTFAVNMAGGALSPLGSPMCVAGTGAVCAVTNPQSVAIEPAQKFLYVANSKTHDVSAFGIGGDGSLSPLGSPVCTLGKDSANKCIKSEPSAVVVNPDGKFAYVANKQGRLTAFGVNADGSLSGPRVLPTAGTGFASLRTDSGGRFAYLTIDGARGTVTAFTIDPVSGGLTPAQPTRCSTNVPIGTCDRTGPILSTVLSL